MSIHQSMYILGRTYPIQVKSFQANTQITTNGLSLDLPTHVKPATLVKSIPLLATGP